MYVRLFVVLVVLAYAAWYLLIGSKPKKDGSFKVSFDELGGDEADEADDQTADTKDSTTNMEEAS